MEPTENPHTNLPNQGGLPFRPSKGFPIVIGVFVVLAGCVSLLIAGNFGIFLPLESKQYGYEESAEVVVSYHTAAMVYTLLGVGLLTLGIGSISLRKWARKLLLALGWLLIAFAALILLGIVLMVPVVMSLVDSVAGFGATSGGPSFGVMLSAMLAIYVVVILLVFAGPGALLVLVYKSKNIALTTEYFHKKPCWTDRVPIPVLILWLFYVVWVLFNLPSLYSWVRIGDFIVEEGLVTSKATWIGTTLFCCLTLSILAYGVSKLAKWSWWASLVCLVVIAMIGYYLFQSTSVVVEQKLIEEMGISEEELDDMDEMTSTTIDSVKRIMRMVLVVSGALLMGVVGYLFWIRKYFFPDDSESISEEELLAQ